MTKSVRYSSLELLAVEGRPYTNTITWTLEPCSLPISVEILYIKYNYSSLLFLAWPHLCYLFLMLKKQQLFF